MTTLLVPHAGASAAVVRHALLRELRQQGVPEDVADDALLVVSELVGNAVRYGRPLAEQSLRVSWWVAGGAVHVEVCDGGPGLPGDAGELRLGARLRDPGAGDMSLPLATGTSSEGGRGLPIVDLLSTRWGTTAPGPSGAVAVYAELPLSEGPSALLTRGGARSALPSTKRGAPWASRTSPGAQWGPPSGGQESASA